MLGQEEQQKAIDSILKDFDSSMTLVYAEVQRLLNLYFMTSDVTKLTSLQFDAVFNRILTEAGYYSVVNEMIDVNYNELFPLIKQGFELGGFTVQYNADDVAIIRALKELQSNTYSVIASTAGSTLRENLYRYSLSNYTVDQMAAQIATDLEGTALVKHTRTYANTLIAEYQQSVIDIKAEDLDGVWLYIGVDDSKNRDFCQCVLDQNAYYDDTTKNKIQGDPRRQYNCRHRLRMVTEDYAKSEGFTFKSSSSC